MDSSSVVLRYMCERSATVEGEKIFAVEYSVLNDIPWDWRLEAFD